LLRYFSAEACRQEIATLTRFVVLSDTHFEAPEAHRSRRITDLSWWNRMLFSRQEEIAQSLVATVTDLAPDFVIHCGDFTNRGDVESFLFGREVMDRLGCPFYIVLGNHDTFRRGTRKAVAPLFGLSEGNFYYRRDLAGLRFVFLDCAYWITRDGGESEQLPGPDQRLGIGPSQDEIDWLRRELDDATEMPTFVVTHPPICAKPAYPIGSSPSCTQIESTPPARPVLEAPLTPCAVPLSLRHEALLQIISRAPNVKAVFAGHWHINDATLSDGILHCQAASLIEFPFEMRLVEIDDRVMSVTAVGLNDASLRESSLVPQWKNQWVEGEPEDRDLTVSLA
jgi:hypothetical protein